MSQRIWLSRTARGVSFAGQDIRPGYALPLTLSVKFEHAPNGERRR